MTSGSEPKVTSRASTGSLVRGRDCASEKPPNASLRTNLVLPLR